MDSYKNAIEAIVYPLIASERRKNTLRRELWAHFCALVEEEQSRGADEPAAARTALERLGDAEEIRAAFMAGLPRSERWLARLERRPGESSRDYARRMAWRLLPLLVVVPIGFGIQCSLVAPNDALVPWTIMGAISAWLPLHLLLALHKTVSWQQLLRRHGSVTPFLRDYAMHAAGTAALAIVSVLLGYGFLAAWTGAAYGDALAYLYMASLVLCFEWVALTATLTYALIREKQAALIIDDWPYSTT